METGDLLSLNELFDVVQPSHNYFSIEQELIETKSKLKLLEDRLRKLEERDSSELSFSMFPMKTPIRDEGLYFCDVNCEEIKIDSKLYIFIGDCLLCNIWDFRIFDHDINTNPSVRFLKQFKNVKTLIIDLSYSIIVAVNSHCSTTRSTEFLINVCKIILYSNSDCEILIKSNELYANSVKFDELFKGLFMKSTNYKKLTIEIKNNLIVNANSGCASYQTAPYINDTKTHCVKNKIAFISNIGI
jgi:hypothetical protein